MRVARAMVRGGFRGYLCAEKASQGSLAMAAVAKSTTADDMLHVMKWHNGDKDWSPFSDEEMSRRQNDLRGSSPTRFDAALFTSYHNISYYSGFLYCYFGRKYGLVIDQNKATTVSAGIDGGQPWRRTFGDNITYTDWRATTISGRRKPDQGRQASRHRVRPRLARLPQADRGRLPGRRVRRHRRRRDVDAHDQVGGGAQADPRRAPASATSARAPAWRAIKAGRARARGGARLDQRHGPRDRRSFPFVELMDTWTWFQSGIKTDGAHNPVTNREVADGRHPARSTASR